MKNLIIIEELSEDGQFSLTYDYDTLPQNVKNKVDEAIADGGATTCNIGDDGLQFLLHSRHPKIENGTPGILKGNVQFYDEDY